MSSGKQRSPKKAAEESNPDFALPGIGNYQFVKTLGEGNFAKVKLAKHKLTEQEVAIKVIDKTQLDEKKVSKLYREVRIMKMLHHPHVVRLYEVIETKSTVFLVMECCTGGELYDYLVVHGRMKEKEARAKFRQILSAVSYCHKKRVIHRDLKAENLLLDSDLNIKIADFGFSNLYDPDAKLDTFCGSPPYAAPELFQGRHYTGPEVDVWSLGVILYVLTTGCLPFDGKNLQEMRESVCRGKYRIPFYLSDTCEKFLRKFLIRDPCKRASLEILIDDPWLNEGFSDSPIASDLSSKPVPEDDALIKVMETKFHVDRATVLKSLRGGIYDDVAAIYYLLYHERAQKGEIGSIPPATTKIVAPPPQAGAGGGGGGSGAVKKESDMVPIDEDAVLQHAPAKVGKPRGGDSGGEVSVVPRGNPRGDAGAGDSRRRRFTVGGEADVAKLADDDDGREAAAALKLLQGTARAPKSAAERPSTSAGGGEADSGVSQQPPQPLPTAEPGVAPASGGGSGAPSAAANAAAEAGASGGALGASAAAGDGPATGRKRHNTIVGLFHNAIRRPEGEANGAPPHAAGAAAAAAAPATTASAVSTAHDAHDAAESLAAAGKPRSLRFTFNSNTTSSKPPDEIVAEVVAQATKQGLQYHLPAKYLIECTAPLRRPAAPGGEQVKFEIEICKLPRLRNLHGLRFKRLSGSSPDYKDTCEKLLESLAL